MNRRGFLKGFLAAPVAVIPTKAIAERVEDPVPEDGDHCQCCGRHLRNADGFVNNVITLTLEKELVNEPNANVYGDLKPGNYNVCWSCVADRLGIKNAHRPAQLREVPEPKPVKPK